MKDYLINILTDDEKKAYLQSTNKLITNLKNAQFPNGWQKKGNYKYTSTLFWLNSIHVNPVADGQTFITDFIPINKPSMFIMSRQSNHPKGSDGNIQKRQTRGIPNVFRDIYFFPSNDYISNDGTVVIINSNHLYNDSDCQQIREAMINMYQNGTFVHPFIADASKQEPMTFTNGIPDVNRISNQSRKGQKKITNKKGNKKKGGKGGNNTPSTPVQPRLNRENTMKKNTIRLNENTLKQIVAESVKKVLKEYELSDREKDIMRGYWGDIENRRMPKQKYEPVNPQSWKKSTPNNQTPKHYSYNSNLNEEGEGIEMMGSIPSESYGKYGNLMEKLDDVGNKEIDYILKDRTRFSNNGTFSSKQVYEMLNSLKTTMIHALDTRYW